MTEESVAPKGRLTPAPKVRSSRFPVVGAGGLVAAAALAAGNEQYTAAVVLAALAVVMASLPYITNCVRDVACYIFVRCAAAASQDVDVTVSPDGVHAEVRRTETP